VPDPSLHVGILIFPGITALDAVGPFEPLSRLPGATVSWIAAEPGEILAQAGLRLHAGTSLDVCEPLDLILVPGGPGVGEVMDDARTLAFLRSQAETARWVTSVCTGSLILGAAGLLQGYRATTHWRYLDCLTDLGATPVRKRVVADRNRITAAGVSAGIDMGLFLAALIAGEGKAREIQLQLEYDPQPPFPSGSPATADDETVASLELATQLVYEQRRAQTRRLGAALNQA
jgi:cyclohexyl-isocyanide hydratase